MGLRPLGRLTTAKDGSGATITTYSYDTLDRVRSYTNAGTTWIHWYAGTTSSIALIRNDTAGTTRPAAPQRRREPAVGYLDASGTGRVS